MIFGGGIGSYSRYFSFPFFFFALRLSDHGSHSLLRSLLWQAFFYRENSLDFFSPQSNINGIGLHLPTRHTRSQPWSGSFSVLRVGKWDRSWCLYPRERRGESPTTAASLEGWEVKEPVCPIFLWTCLDVILRQNGTALFADMR